MISSDTFFRNARLVDDRVVDILVKDGTIRSLENSGQRRPDGVAEIDLRRRLVLPGFVEGHIHLDKGFIGEPWKPHRPCTAGFDVRERVGFEKQALAEARPARDRALAMVDLCVSQGTTTMRSHVDVDPVAKLTNLDAVLEARERNTDRITIQIVAFPQSGIITAPGTLDLLDAACRNGADLIGGLDPAGFDNDITGHLDAVFGIAERRGVPVDIHLHDPDMLGVFQLTEIASRTKALGFGGRVAVSHAYALGQVPIDVARRTGEILADAGVSIMTNAPGNHPFPPISVLRQAGVTVFAGNDNIRDAWWPYGDGDLLERAMIVGYRSGFYTDAELQIAFEMITQLAAKALGLANYGIVPGAPADFVVVDARHPQEVVVERPKRRTVFKSGRQVAGKQEASVN